MRKYIAIIITIAMFFSFIPVIPAMASNPYPVLDPNSAGRPLNYALIKGSGVQEALSLQKPLDGSNGIYAYGSISQVNSDSRAGNPNNNYKLPTPYPFGTIVPAGTQGAIPRYIGYTYDDQLIPNPDFSNDSGAAGSELPPSQKNWVNAFSVGDEPKAPFYNTTTRQQRAAWLRTMIWVNDSTQPSNPKFTDEFLDNSFNVLEAPGQYTVGIAKGWRDPGDNTLRYQTFVMPSQLPPPPDTTHTMTVNFTMTLSQVTGKSGTYNYNALDNSGEIFTASIDWTNTYINTVNSQGIVTGSVLATTFLAANPGYTIAYAWTCGTPGIIQPASPTASTTNVTCLKVGYTPLTLTTTLSQNGTQSCVGAASHDVMVLTESSISPLITSPATAPMGQTYTVQVVMGSITQLVGHMISLKWYCGTTRSNLVYMPGNDGLYSITDSSATPCSKFYQVIIVGTDNTPYNSNDTETDTIDNTPTSIHAVIVAPSIFFEGVHTNVTTNGSYAQYGTGSTAKVYYPGGADHFINSYIWTISQPYTGSLGYCGGSIRCDTVGALNLALKLTIPSAYDIAQASATVIATPYCQFITTGTKKINRRLVVDYSNTIVHEDYPLNPAKCYVLIKDDSTGDTIKSTTTGVTTLNGSNTYLKSNAIVSTSTGGSATITIKKVGNFDVTVYVEDTRGHNSTSTQTYSIMTDIPPVAKFAVNTKLYRGTDGVARAIVQKNGTSLDNDAIGTHTVSYRYDTNNDGNLNDESWIDYTNNNTTQEIDVSRVGQFQIKYTVTETYDNVPAFVVPTDFLSNTQTVTCEVYNIAPITSFDLINKTKADMLFITDTNDYQNAVTDTGSMSSTLNNNPNLLVDVSATNITADTNDINHVVQYVPQSAPIYQSTYTSVPAAQNNNNSDYAINTGTPADMAQQGVNLATASNDTTWLYNKTDGTTQGMPWNSNTFVNFDLTTSNYQYIYGSRYVFNGRYQTKVFAYTNFSNVYYLYELNPDTGAMLWKLNVSYIDNPTLQNMCNTLVVNADKSEEFILGTEYNKLDSKGNILHQEYIPDTYIGNDGNYYYSYSADFVYSNSNVTYTSGGAFEGFTVYKTQNNVKTAIYSNYSFYSSLWAANIQGKFYNGYLYLFYSEGYPYVDTDNLIKMDSNGSIINSVTNTFTDTKNTNQSCPIRAYFAPYGIVTYAYDVGSLALWVYDYNINALYNNYRNEGSLVPYIFYENFNVGIIVTAFSSSGHWYYYVTSLKTGSCIEEFACAYGFGPNIIAPYNDIAGRYLCINYCWYSSRGYNQYYDYYYDFLLDTVSTDTNSNTNGTGFGVVVDDNNVFYDIGSTQVLVTNGTISTGNRGDSIANGTNFISPNANNVNVAVGSPQFIDNYIIHKGFYSVLQDLNGYTPRSTAQYVYIPFIISEPISLTNTQITNIITAIKSKNAKAIFCGSAANQSIGQQIASGTGGVYYQYNGLQDAYNYINSYVSNCLASIPSNVIISVQNGATIPYSTQYTDYENDPLYTSGSAKWTYTQDLSYAHPEGVLPQNGQVLSAPLTSINYSGKYSVTYQAQDNPSPGTATYGSYRQWSLNSPGTIIVYDGTTPPVVSIPPSIAVNVSGDLRQNHRVDFEIQLTRGDKAIDMSTLNISLNNTTIGKDDSLPGTKPNTLNFSRVFTTSGSHTVTINVKDTSGVSAAQLVYTFIIAADLPATPGFYFSGSGLRDTSGYAQYVLHETYTATDDSIGSVSYSMQQTKYVDDGTGALRASGTSWNNLTFADNGGLSLSNVGTNTIMQTVTENYTNGTGLNGENLDQYRVFQTSTTTGAVTVTNTPPTITYSVSPQVVLKGSQIQHTVNVNDDTNGVKAQYYFTQNANYYKNPDGLDAMNNVTTTLPTSSLNEKGLYTFYAQAVDKDGATSSWVNGGQVKVVSLPIAAMSFYSDTTKNGGQNTEIANNVFELGSVISIANNAYDPDYSSSEKGLQYIKVEYKYANQSSFTTLYEQSNLTTWPTEFDMPAASEKDMCQVNMTVTSLDGFTATTSQTFTIMDLRLAASLTPTTIMAGDSYTINATLSNDALGALANKEDGTLIQLNKTSSDANNSYYSNTVTTPLTIADGNYTITAKGEYPFSNELQNVLTLNVKTVINLIPAMPSPVISGDTIQVNATTDYLSTSAVSAILFKGTTYQTSSLALVGSIGGGKKNWTANYTIPASVPDGTYTAEYTAAAPNGNTEVKTVNFDVISLKITSVGLTGYWNHWRGEVDIFGKQLTNEPLRFLSLEKVKINVQTTGYADKIVVRFSPELESMQFTDAYGHVYDYKNDFFGYYVNFPQDSTFLLDNSKKDNTLNWEYALPLAPSTKDWNDIRLKPGYTMTITAYKGTKTAVQTITGIELTGNTNDLTFIQPIN